MAAIINIPFNNQPVQTVVTTASYTVPAGKYAKVNLENAILPTLNAVALYTTRALPGSISATTSYSTPYTLSLTNAHRISFSVNNSTSVWAGGGLVKMSVTTSNVIYYGTATITPSTQVYYSSTGNGTYSHTFSSAVTSELYHIFANAIAGSTTITSITVDSYNPQELWVKSGDVIGLSAGKLVYTEYNVIS